MSNRFTGQAVQFVNAAWAASVVNDSNELALVKTDNGGVSWDMLNPMVAP
jgi:hypothetical protein